MIRELYNVSCGSHDLLISKKKYVCDYVARMYIIAFFTELFFSSNESVLGAFISHTLLNLTCISGLVKNLIFLRFRIWV